MNQTSVPILSYLISLHQLNETHGSQAKHSQTWSFIVLLYLYVHLVQHKTKHTPNSCVKLESLTILFQEIQLFPISNLLQPSGVVRYWQQYEQSPEGELDGSCQGRGQKSKYKKQLFLGMAMTSPRFAGQLAWTKWMDYRNGNGAKQVLKAYKPC